MCQLYNGFLAYTIIVSDQYYGSKVIRTANRGETGALCLGPLSYGGSQAIEEAPKFATFNCQLFTESDHKINC